MANEMFATTLKSRLLNAFLCKSHPIDLKKRGEFIYTRHTDLVAPGIAVQIVWTWQSVHQSEEGEW